MDIIFDMDGTLMNIEHRRHHVSGDKKDWQAFKNATVKDTPYDMICDLAVMLSEVPDNRIIICTGRNETEEWITEKQLLACGIPYHALLMRPNDDYDPDDILKQRMLQELRREGYNPQMVFDDRNSVVAMWRANGLTCLQCADGDF